MNNLRFALRQLRKSPGFTVIAALTLALGIGANSAIFSVVNHVLLRPLPYPHSDRLVYLNEVINGADTAIALPDYLDWRRDASSFEHLAISRLESRNLSGIPRREPERISVAYVTANFFNVIGLPPQIGRTFTEEEDKSGAAPLAVISDRLWERAFHRDPRIVGRPMNFHATPVTVIGVMPPEMDAPHGVDAWFTVMRRANNPAWQNRANHPMFYGWGRLKNGVTVEQARGEIKALTARIEKLNPATNTGVGANLRPLLDNLLGNYRTSLTLLLGAVAVVLLIACANLANLLAVRGAARAREFAVRAAMGAGRGQIIRQLLTESFVISTIGGGVGLIFATWGRDALVALAPAGAPRFEGMTFDWRVMAFTFLLATFTTILFGLWPAWQAARTDINAALQAGSFGSSETKAARRSRDWLVIAEVALTLLLLTAAGLVLKSFAKMQSTQLGFNPQQLLTVHVELPFTRYDALNKILGFTTPLLDEVRKLPGVQYAALSSNPPMLSGWQLNFMPEGAPPTDPSQQPAADNEVVQGDYFAALGINLIRGRTFNEHDAAASPKVVIIDQTLADLTFKGQDPIGKRIMVDTESDSSEGPALHEIVGIVPHVKFRGYNDTNPTPSFFFPQTQVGRTSFVLHLRAAGNVKRLDKPVREIITRLDPAQPVFDVLSMDERVAATWATQRLLTFLLTIFAGLALLLAAVGLYGVLAYSTARRVREIAVRLALGARPAQIRSLIVGQGLRLFGVGIIVGAFAVIASSGVLRSFLFAVSPLDPQTYLAVGLILSFVTILAAWLPARRACRINPIVALRAE